MRFTAALRAICESQCMPPQEALRRSQNARPNPSRKAQISARNFFRHKFESFRLSRTMPHAYGGLPWRG
jgi:hypothetical protein